MTSIVGDPKKNPAVGIDLGTTNTVVAVQTDQLGPVALDVPQPKDERQYLVRLPQIKSALYFESANSSVVGAFASERLESFRSIKSHMGTRWRAKHPITGTLLKPSYISAHILRLAFQTIASQFPLWDHTALVTVPASFNTDQRNDTILAANMAGFRNIRLLDEPTAAFYYFFSEHGEAAEFRAVKNVLVFDFGGGTLDVSIINIEEKNNLMLLDTFGRSRYNNLGGDDIDLDLAVFMIGCWEFENNIQTTALSNSLRKNFYRLFIEKARLYKEEVEDCFKNNLDMPEFVIDEEIHTKEEKQHIIFRRVLSRNHYEDITGKYMQSKSDLNIYRPIEEALSVAKEIKPTFSAKNLDLVLYTGGASNMSSVQAALKAYFSPTPCFSISEADACNTVALGAACCRYEELYGKRNITMTNRLLEGIFTRHFSGFGYFNLIPLTAEPEQEFVGVAAEFKTERPTIRLRLPLFRGVSSSDHQLAPMRDLEIALNEIVPKNTPYRINYRLSENKTVEIKVFFYSKDGSQEAVGKLDLFEEIAGDGTKLGLCEVNKV